MSAAAITPSTATVGLDQLLGHNQEETKRWRAFFAAQPQALGVQWQNDVANVRQMVRQMLRHIFAVELLYAEVVIGRPRAKIVYHDFLFATLDELFATGEKARELFRTVLRQAGYKQDWAHDFIFTEVME